MSNIVSFKAEEYDRLSTELRNADPAIVHILRFIVGYTLDLVGKAITVTGIYRTQEEQDALHSKLEAYRDNPWKSYHQCYMAVDLRFSPLIESQWEALKSVLEIMFARFGIRVIVHPPFDPPAHVHIEIHKTFQEVADDVRTTRA